VASGVLNATFSASYGCNDTANSGVTCIAM
jgi:hypothetical protein